jgi:hypothetical protein
VIARIASAAIGCVLLSGCAMVREDWLDHPTHPPLPPYHIEIAQADLERACGNYPGVYGCAIRLPEDRACLIYTGPKPAPWLLEHERKHCAGWDHGPWLGIMDPVVKIAARPQASAPGEVPGAPRENRRRTLPSPHGAGAAAAQE